MQKASPAKKVKDNNWFTPAKYVDAAREVFGGVIDLDPASCEQANQTVKATRYYTKDDNGLMRPWRGNTWCNPPYGRTQGNASMSHQKAFAEKLQLEYATGNVGQAILLSLGNPNSMWFQPFFDFTLCFLRGRIHFHRPDGTFGDFGFPLAFVYLGPNEAKFTQVFSRFGRIVRAIDNQQPKPVMRELWSTTASTISTI